MTSAAPEQSSKPFEPSLSVDTLNPAKEPELAALLRSSQAIIADVDYTLIDISAGHDAGVAAVARITDKTHAARFNEIFHLIVDGHRQSEVAEWEDRAAFDQIIERIRKIQVEIIPKWGLKYWSKETMLLMAAEDVGLSLTSEQLKAARDAYWQTRTNHSIPYDYVHSFCEFLLQNGVLLILFTSSYHIMQIKPDLSLSYDPDESYEYKLAAITPRVPEMVFSIIIGDPVDKPDPAFFEKVLAQTQLDLGLGADQKLDLSTICAMGDSLRNDLEYLGRRGCKTVLVHHG